MSDDPKSLLSISEESDRLMSDLARVIVQHQPSKDVLVAAIIPLAYRIADITGGRQKFMKVLIPAARASAQQLFEHLPLSIDENGAYVLEGDRPEETPEEAQAMVERIEAAEEKRIEKHQASPHLRPVPGAKKE